MTDCSPSLPSFVFWARALPPPIRRCLILSASELLKYLEIRYQADIAASQTTIARGRNPITLNLHHLVEQIRPQADTGAQQFFVELRPDDRGCEAAQNFPIRIHAPLVEHKKVLQR